MRLKLVLPKSRNVDSVLKEMFADIIQETLEAELDTELAYPKN